MVMIVVNNHYNYCYITTTTATKHSLVSKCSPNALYLLCDLIFLVTPWSSTIIREEKQKEVILYTVELLMNQRYPLK